MQTIKHDKGYFNIFPIMNDIEKMYSELSDTCENVSTSTSLWNNPIDLSLQPIRKLFEEKTAMEYAPQTFENKQYKTVKLPNFDPKNIIVCYSGGKDSFSVIRHYQKKGYNVYAYHIRGLNKTYYDEWEVAEKMAEELNVPLTIDHISYSGYHRYIEHPMKNMIMLNMALTWGIRNGITTKVAVGTFYTAELDDIAFEVCGGDCKDMWALYEKVIQRVLPKFKVYIPNKNFQTAYYALINEPQYLPMTISCLTPNRFRQQFRDRTLRNYPNIELMPKRCGCCWKCATEYIWFCDHNILPFDKDYYIHCMEVLLNTIEQETGYLIHNIDYVWKSYMFYPMQKSKAYKELQNAFIRSRKIQIAD